MKKVKTFLVLSASLLLLSVSGCASSKQFTEKPIKSGTMVPGESLGEKLAWLERNADSHNTYILELNADETIAAHTFEYRGASDITIALRGAGENRTIRISPHGTIFTIRSGVTVVLDNNITLQGHRKNTGPLVNVDGGKFVMRTGSRISDNDRGSGDGGGVYMRSGEFYITGGAISGSSAANGGGVFVADGNFAMSGGTISGNAAENGGGVHVSKVFDMRGGTISNNTAVNGGGMYVANANVTDTYIKVAGVITGNTAGAYGGGVYVNRGSIQVKRGGVITGYKSDQRNGNAIRDEDGNVMRGYISHAVFSNNYNGVFAGINLRRGKEHDSTIKSNTTRDFLLYGAAIVAICALSLTKDTQ